MSRIVLGSRGSDLARAQAALVEQALRAAHPELEIALEIILTSGDEKLRPPGDAPQGLKGMFTAEIERALLAGRIDVAVHSAKDLPSEPVANLEICAALPRAAVEDVLVAKEISNFASLPAHGTVATGSVRRQHQLRWLRPDLKIAELRGNVPTRLRKLTNNPWDAIILARAGLERLGFAVAAGELEFEEHKLHSAILSPVQFLPAGGQGIVALQIRSRDAAARSCVGPLNHAPSLLCLRAEREFLRLLQGDCGTPVGVLATLANGAMEMRAQIFDDGSIEPRTAEVSGTAEAETLAARLWEQINGG